MLLSTQIIANEYSYRKYKHVKDFYSSISYEAIEVARKHHLPPAALLAIAGLESGYGSGYVSQITGNILSLGAFKGDAELPRLYLPYSKSKKKVLFDPNEIKKMPKNDLVWKKRPKSYKRDYRPAPYAGTTHHLELLLYNKELRENAHLDCLNDFATRWIVTSSKVKSFREARQWLDQKIEKEGIDILFNMDLNKEFVSKIGGHPNSFNYRESWPKKVKKIMHKVGLVQLTEDMYKKNMTFDSAWSKR